MSYQGTQSVSLWLILFDTLQLYQEWIRETKCFVSGAVAFLALSPPVRSKSSESRKNCTSMLQRGEAPVDGSA